jgi:RNA polymerase primary sigma factor
MYEDDPVRVYLNEMGTVPPLTREQEAQCVRHIRAKDEQADVAEKDLVEANLALVVAIAKKHPSDRVHILDLIMVGNDALMQAVRAFADRGAGNFSAFAERYIEGAVEHAVVTSEPTSGNC